MRPCWRLPLLLAAQLSSCVTQRVVLHIVADDMYVRGGGKLSVISRPDLPPCPPPEPRGYNDLGFVNSELHTPHIDELRNNGIALSRLYTSKDCAPSRGSIMTGRYPFHFGYYRNPSDEGGVMLNVR